jgi:hypothetical protein
MSPFLVWLFIIGAALVVEGVLARHELLVYSGGWWDRVGDRPLATPVVRGAAAGRPPDAYLVYLDGIGKLHSRDSRDGGELVRSILAEAPELRVLGGVLPYSPAGQALAARPAWSWLRRHRAVILLLLHNVVQTFVAADHRYRPLYNQAVGAQISRQLVLAGYRRDTGIPVVLLSYSGGAQVATGSVARLYDDLRCPLVVVTLGGFHNGANDLTYAEQVFRLTSDHDRIERLGTWLFPQRWRVVPSGWNRARREGKVTTYRLDPAKHVGAQSYISPTALLPDGRTHLARTTAVVVSLVRGHLSQRGSDDVTPSGRVLSRWETQEDNT